MLTIQVCDYDQAAAVLALVPELLSESAASLAARVGDKPALLLVAYHDNQLAGVKVGYEQSEDTFYSWLGGVVPEYRRYGVAQALLEFQQEWVTKKGYAFLTVKSRNRFPAMLRLLLRNGYAITSCEPKGDIQDYRILFRKVMT